MSLLLYYIEGWVILAAAILLNVVAGKCGIRSWYDLLLGLSREGRSWLDRLRIIDYAWLLVLYPFLLGFCCLLCSHIRGWTV
jgi:hypothetical protein